MTTPNGSHDFDFFFGRWRVENRRLRERLLNCEEWDTFEAVCDCHPLERGLGNVDTYVTDYWPNFSGATVRIFNPHTQQWALFWADTRSGELGTPVIGSFKDGVGIFYGPDELRGKPVLVRFIWSDITPTSTRWEQAFSPDDGQTWEVNWVMTSTRIEDTPA